MRRFLDIFFLLALFPILLPLILISIPLKMIFDGLPIFYLSKRIGRNKKDFLVFKFRTMILDRNIIANEVAKNSKGGFEAIPISSVVYTNAGRLFEKLQIVEMPQLINIFFGQMSFVGYRPLPNSHINILNSELGLTLVDMRHKSIPGITGFAQLIGKANLTNAERIKIEIDEASFFDARGNWISKIFVYIYLILFTGLLLISGKAPYVKTIYRALILKKDV
jgi:lipopolysaccharide/colanic/teichoic acid biosynthesis glycosyltransferase